MAPITDISQLDLSKSYTYADYLSWRFTEYVELVKGRVMQKMSAPATAHQQASRNIAGELYRALKGQSCQFFPAPFDVRLLKATGNGDSQITTVVQPDLCVVCDPAKIDKRGCLGAPDWVIEVISPKTARYDTTVKAALYAENGVREYWIVFPNEQIVQVFALQGEDYKLAGVYSEPGLVPSLVLPELALEWADVFEGLPE